MDRFGRVLLVLGAFVALVAAGCGKAAEKVAEKATEKAVESACQDEQQGDCSVDIDKDSGEVKLKTDEGEVVVGSDELPEDWPDDVPVPDGFAVSGSSSTDTPDGKVIVVGGTVDMSAEEVVGFYEDEMSGWENSTPPSYPNGVVFKDGERTFMANVAEAGGQTTLSLSYTGG